MQRLPLIGSSIDGLLFRCEQLQVELLPVVIEDIVASGRLEAHHSDPFDRMLIAQAKRGGFVLMTGDRKMQRYDVERIW